MNEEKGMMNEMAPESGEMGMDKDISQVCVPVSALAIEGDEGSAAPVEGDSVDFNVSGSVDKIDGKNAYVTITKVNGNDLPDSSEENSESAPEASAEGEALRGKAMAQDKEMDY